MIELKAAGYGQGFARAVARCVFSLLLLVMLGSLGTPASARTYVDRRVDELSTVQLLHAVPQTLVDDRRQAAAVRFGGIRRLLFLTWVFAQIGTLLVLWRAGTAARIRDSLRARGSPPVLMRFIFGVVVTIVTAAVAAPVSFVRYRSAVRYDLSAQSPWDWLAGAIFATAIDALIVGLLVAAIFTLVERTHLWYAYSTIGLLALAPIVVALQPVILAPLFERSAVVPPDHPLAAAFGDLKIRAGIPNLQLLVSDDSQGGSVLRGRVEGVGPTARIVVGSALLRDATPPEVAFVAAHEIGHFVRGDVLRLALVASGLLVLCAAIAVMISEHVGFRRDDDPLARLPLVGALLGCALLVAFPIYNAFARGREAEADRYALELGVDRAAAVRTFVRLADARLILLCPPPAVEWYFNDHPALAARIAAARGEPATCQPTK